jgi:para-nitrobenzyl esterase
VRDASQPGSACPQEASFFGPPSENEDCLYLNVYVPRDAGDNLPVLFWIHGGDFITGQGSDYNGSALAQAGNVIVVSINYRLGIFGFYAHRELARETHDNDAGNYGLQDQQLALRWVRDNIHAFGGDPGSVTIAGESAGGLSVLSHLASPAAAGLFQHAIVQSGGYRLAWPKAGFARMKGADIAGKLGCLTSVVDCMRGKSVTELLAAQGDSTSLQALLMWGPNVSGGILPQQPMKAVLNDDFNRVPVMMGTNHDEGGLFVGVSYGQHDKQITAATYASVIKSVYGSIAAPLVQWKYPLTAYANPDTAFARLFGDSGLSCQSYMIERALASRTTTYVYELNDANAPMVFLPPYDFSYGSTHTSELPYLFPDIHGYIYNLGTAAMDHNQLQLAATMRGMWTQFARHGDPNGTDLPLWFPYVEGNDNFMELAPTAVGMTTGFVKYHHCDFWEPLLRLNAILPPWLTGAVH